MAEFTGPGWLTQEMAVFFAGLVVVYALIFSLVRITSPAPQSARPANAAQGLWK
jgi:xanthosine utilization system XapX-like protein